jgi:hypothetical protein
MAADRKAPNTLAYGFGMQDWTLESVPRAIKTRYVTDERDGGRAYYVEPTDRRPAFRDEGVVLATARSDRQVIEDMMGVAGHRLWMVVKVTGSRAFRREAWLEGESYGIDVKGYKPSEHDLQDAERRLEQQLAAQRADQLERIFAEHFSRVREAMILDNPLKALEAGIKARIVDPLVQARLLEGARDRIAGWLERGGRFEKTERSPSAPTGRERDHGR